MSKATGFTARTHIQAGQTCLAAGYSDHLPKCQAGCEATFNRGVLPDLFIVPNSMCKGYCHLESGVVGGVRCIGDGVAAVQKRFA